MRPILKYHGGKWRLAPWIISNFPEHRCYVEPFCGAASVLLRKKKVASEVINDLYGRLINVFKVLRDPQTASILKQLIAYTPYSAQEYVLAREVSADPIEDARKMIILGQQGFGSNGPSGGKLSGWRRGLRQDRERSSADEWAGIYKNVEKWCDRLRGVFIENKPAIEVIHQWDGKETLFYVDPPYISSTRHGPGNEGYAHEMTDSEHLELAEVLHDVSGQVVISGYNSGLYDELYGSWEKIEKEAMADRGKHTVECLWISPAGTNPNFDYKAKGSLF